MVALHPGAVSAAPAKLLWLAALIALALVAGAVSLTMGSVPIGAGAVASALAHPTTSDLAHSVVWDIRLPRLLIAACVGAGLGVAGAMLQALFRNPLVDPYVSGVSAGAALAAAASIALGASFALVPALAFGGGLACAALVTLIGASSGSSGNLRLVLSGIAISSLCAAVVTIVLLRSG